MIDHSHLENQMNEFKSSGYHADSAVDCEYTLSMNNHNIYIYIYIAVYMYTCSYFLLSINADACEGQHPLLPATAMTSSMEDMNKFSSITSIPTSHHDINIFIPTPLTMVFESPKSRKI